MNDQAVNMPFWDHVEELRSRLIKSIFATMLGAIFVYGYSDFIMQILILPLDALDMDISLQVLKVTSMFTTKLSIALFGGIICGLPVIMYQFWRFVLPAFEDRYTLLIFISIFFSVIFFIIGMSFAYFIIVPFSLRFFTSLINENIDIIYNFTLEAYLIYILWLIFGSGLVFQLPIISTFFTRIGILTPAFLREYRKFAIIIFLILGAILTPPDPLSQILIVIPLVLLYEFSILISKIFKPAKLL